MSFKVLDYSGLSYFWSKIKNWVTSKGYITSSGSITGNAGTATKLATARSISAGNLEFQGSANFDGSGNIVLNVTNHRSIVNVGNTNNYPFHRIAYIPTLTGNYADRGITFLVSKDFSGGGWGICRIILRTNNATGGQTANCNVQWLVRSNEISADSIQVGFCKTANASYIDVFYKSAGVYHSAVCRVLAHSDSRTSVGRGFTVVSASTEANSTTATDPKTSVESYKTIADAGTALHNQAYTDIIAASDVGVVGNAATASAVAWSGVTGKPTTIAGYGITDAKIANGTITLGSNSITPLTNDNNYVHKTGNESIAGNKYFSDNIVCNEYVNIINTDLTKGTNPSVSEGCAISCFGDTGATTDNDRIGYFSSSVGPSGDSITEICSYINSTSDHRIAKVSVGWDINGRAFAIAPSTSEDRSYGLDIVTRDWIPKDTRVVHTTGDENIAGDKTFTGTVSCDGFYARSLEFNRTSGASHGGFIDFRFNGSSADYTSRIIESESGVLTFFTAPRFVSNSGTLTRRASSSDFVRGTLPSSTQYGGWYGAYHDANAHEVATDQINFSPNGAINRRIVVNAWVPHGSTYSSSFVEIAVGYRDSTISNGVVTALGTPYAICPSTPDTGGGMDIVTRNWIPKDTRIVHTTGAETIAGQKTFTSIIFGGDAGNSAFFSASAAAANKLSTLVCGGSYYNQGAYLQVFGGSHSTAAGYFSLNASPNGANTKSLVGTPAGNLTWNGQTIQTTSDERLKTPLSAVPGEVLDAWGEVEWGEFRFLDAVAEKGDSARLHAGLIAQAVDRKFAALGLDARRYGILCHEVYPAVSEERADDGTVTVPASDESELWTVRYAEALCMEAAYQRRENARLKKRIADLEERLAALELKVS